MAMERLLQSPLQARYEQAEDRSQQHHKECGFAP